MSILLYPHLSNKSSNYHKVRKYAFIVARGANKITVRKEVEKIYKVAVASVATMNYEGKRVARYTRKRMIKGVRKKYKKAVVLLREGYTIDLHQQLNG